MWARRMRKFSNRLERDAFQKSDLSVLFCCFRIPILDFPSCVIGDSPPELTSDSLVIGDTAPYSWRNSKYSNNGNVFISSK